MSNSKYLWNELEKICSDEGIRIYDTLIKDNRASSSVQMSFEDGEYFHKIDTFINYKKDDAVDFIETLLYKSKFDMSNDSLVKFALQGDPDAWDHQMSILLSEASEKLEVFRSALKSIEKKFNKVILSNREAQQGR